MSWRTVIVTERSKVDYRMGYMLVRGENTHRIFMDEIGTVLIESTAVALTAVWLNECIRRKIKVIFCDEKRNPAWEAVPYSGSHDASRCLRNQIRWPPERKAAVWAKIVAEKICRQAQVLSWRGLAEEQRKLTAYIGEIEPGDRTNREGHAAKVYFNALLGRGFSRNDGTTENAALDYGYAILLSACNREISAYGYLPMLGIFHDNVFNPFNLGCDLMEPFRPLVDRLVLEMEPQNFGTAEKHKLVDVLNRKVRVSKQEVTVARAISLSVRSVLDAMEGEEIEKIGFYDAED